MDESFTFPCTFFVKDGAPDEKTCTIQIVKLFPDGNEAIIAAQEFNLAMHFGKFPNGSVNMELTKKAEGHKPLEFTYQAYVRCTNNDDRPTFNQCVQWCSLQHQVEERQKKNEEALNAAIAAGEITPQERTFKDDFKESAFGRFTSSTVDIVKKAGTKIGGIAGGGAVSYAIEAHEQAEDAQE